ncbi:calcium-binding protein [Pseudodonghicola flavimaris]|uniref:Calcium-binding protein n=1 Tax=Pseudodonghicola flavimaris TaxID=3050036 RepID=A0ABT7EVC6_9RHOB|nr:calcium-binding protein [Pseudodonghicola flavimaris]MDK3016244.1 calcium-binding protein [Pseudodonghicola flavimaris]
MTTYTLEGARADWRDNADWTDIDYTGFSPSATFIVTTTPDGGLTYSLRAPEADGDVWADETLTQTYFIGLDNAVLLPDAMNNVLDAEFNISEITWKIGGVVHSTTLLEFAVEWGDDATGHMLGSDFFFVIDGDSLPSFSSLAEFEAFANSDTYILSQDEVTGAFAEGEYIPWSALQGIEVATEDDQIYGTRGKDVLIGGIGEDEFYSSKGDDTYDGGADFDELHYSGDPAGVTVDLGTGIATDGWGDTDTISNIELVRGSLFADTLIGGAAADQFRGLAGDDLIKGGKGGDTVRYDKDADYAGGDNGVSVNLGTGTATDGFGDKDKLVSIEHVKGSDFNDTIIGNKVANRIDGNAGADTIKGKGGNDTLDGSGGNDKIFGGTGRDTLNGDAGRDTLKGEGGKDILSGGSENDTLLGGTGNDKLLGGTGNDRLDGGADNDRLIGGGGADTFIFSGKFGDDVITDFNTVGIKERIDLSGVSSITGFRDLVNNHISDVGGDAVIDDGNGNTITLLDISVDDLAKNDFLF